MRIRDGKDSRYRIKGSHGNKRRGIFMILASSNQLLPWPKNKSSEILAPPGSITVEILLPAITYLNQRLIRAAAAGP